MMLLTFCFIKVFLLVLVDSHLQFDPPGHNNAFDLNLYEDVLDPEECARQLDYIMNNTALRIEFLDAGARTPRGILTGNLRDMGNYFQCLGIHHENDDSSIEGKYCVMQLPLQQDEFEWPSLPILPEIPEIPWPNVTWPPNNSSEQDPDENIIEKLSLFNNYSNKMRIFLGENNRRSSSRVAEDSQLAGSQFELAVCLPKVCSVKNAVENLTPNSTLQVEEAFCRLPNDKPWVAADIVAVVIFSFIGLMVMLSTSYDIYQNVLREKASKQASTLYTTFSVFTNSRKLFTFNPTPNAITCLDGIRSFAMMWVIVGHTFVTQLSFIPANPLDMSNFMTAFTSLWITSATITVDTFFMISGLLLVYTTASKVSRMSFIKNLHLFYLNRLFRMFPVLGTAVLMQASFQNRVTDGPYWYVNAQNTNNCRQYWWTTLLYVQNLVNPENMCLSHSWYLAIDMQMYFISPIILFWVLGGNKRSAWTALVGAVMVVVTASSIYNFIMEFQSNPVSLSRTPEESLRYLNMYYLHTLPRAAPFFVGMIFGYALNLVKGKTLRLPKLLVAFFWIFAAATSTAIFIAPYYTIQRHWSNQTMDNVLNSFMRPAWAATIGWLIFACTKGYGGPINWILSIHVFKILGRLSYAMYILHYPLIYIVNGTALAPIFFSVERSMHRFLIDFMTTVIAAYIVTIVIDLPCSRLIGMLLGGGKGNKRHAKKNDDLKTKDDVIPDVCELKKSHIDGTLDVTRI